MAHLATFLLLIFGPIFSLQHARFMDPPSRASMWRQKEFNFLKADVNDNQSFCGGITVQHKKNGGKCGICGDPWHAARKQHEVGGSFAFDIITKTYKQGSNIPVSVEVTANHKGYFEFKLCAKKEEIRKCTRCQYPEPTQECFDQMPLKVGGADPAYPTRYPIKPGHGIQVVNVRLPTDVTCDQCVLQWTYTCGNNWGYCPETPGQGKLGCGPQETFRSCADIKITSSSQQQEAQGAEGAEEDDDSLYDFSVTEDEVEAQAQESFPEGMPEATIRRLQEARRRIKELRQVVIESDELIKDNRTVVEKRTEDGLIYHVLEYPIDDDDDLYDY